MSFHCYAQRLLNPFRGVMNVIELDGAEAVTTNGVHWDIYVRDLELVKDIENERRIQTSDIRYGSWSEKQGLIRGPIYPSEDFKALEHRGALVYEYLLQHHRDIPFAFTDHIELWLLDNQRRPLALIDSVTAPCYIDPDILLEWRPGQRCKKLFQSSHLKRERAGDRIEQLINSRVNREQPANWFRRKPDGSGECLKTQTTLSLEHFPRFFIPEQLDETAEPLIQDYLGWLSPYLLLLQNLSSADRASFEQQARRHAMIVEQQFRLYPEIIDAGALAAARVEAELRHRLPDTNEASEEAMSTDYIELNNITRTN